MQNSTWILRISPTRTLSASVVARVVTSGRTNHPDCPELRRSGYGHGGDGGLLPGGGGKGRQGTTGEVVGSQLTSDMPEGALAALHQESRQFVRGLRLAAKGEDDLTLSQKCLERQEVPM